MVKRQKKEKNLGLERPTAMDVEGSGDVCRYYAFILGALEVDKVIEIKVGYEDRVHPVSRINFPVIGVMELGHEIIPILDISLKLGIKETQNQSQTRTIIVVETVLNHQERKCGFRIDSLLDVMEVRPRDILETSLYQPDIKQFFISNQLSQCKEVIKILDIDTILAEIEQYFPMDHDPSEVLQSKGGDNDSVSRPFYRREMKNMN